MSYVWPNETIDRVASTAQNNIVSLKAIEDADIDLRSAIVGDTIDKLAEALQTHAVEISPFDVIGVWYAGVLNEDHDFIGIEDEELATHECFTARWHPAGRPVRLVGGEPDGRVLLVPADPVTPGTIEVAVYDDIEPPTVGNPFPEARGEPRAHLRYRRTGWDEGQRVWLFGLVEEGGGDDD